MKRTVLLIVAGMLIAIGLLWTLQGLGYVGGSAMTGDRTWALVGPFVTIIGVVFGLAARRKP